MFICVAKKGGKKGKRGPVRTSLHLSDPNPPWRYNSRLSNIYDSSRPLALYKQHWLMSNNIQHPQHTSQRFFHPDTETKSPSRTIMPAVKQQQRLLFSAVCFDLRCHRQSDAAVFVVSKQGTATVGTADKRQVAQGCRWPWTRKENAENLSCGWQFHLFHF